MSEGGRGGDGTKIGQTSVLLLNFVQSIIYSQPAKYVVQDSNRQLCSLACLCMALAQLIDKMEKSVAKVQ